VIVLDLSRLLSRAGREAATGIDRVELAYAEHLIATYPITGRSRAGFAAAASLPGMAGRIGSLPRSAAEAYVRALAASWREGQATRAEYRRIRSMGLRLRLAPFFARPNALPSRLRTAAATPFYFLVSHHHLEDRRAIERLKQRGGARFICLIHDLIPTQFPEYAKPGQGQRHRERIEGAAALADGVIVAAEATGDAFLPFLDRAGRRSVPVLVAPFGLDLPSLPPDSAPPLAPPYFVYVGTIEARKNHLLLLNLWRALAQEIGAAAPRLVLIGQRGWETENVIDMLERCPGLRGLVIEHNRLPDAEMARLLKGARALLLPSFAEGFGFPVIEALALGVPALCSDVPGLRETGGGVPELIDPLDGCGWRTAILDYATDPSPRREAQLQRLSEWRPTSWADHFAAVERLVERVAASPR